MRLIDADPIYKRLEIDEEIARKRAIDTPNSFPYGAINPSAIRYMTQLDERERFKKMVHDAQTIDQVKHGEWIKMSDADGVYWACSECGEALPRIPHYNPQFDLFPGLKSIDKTPYCPKCGARMDKAKKLEEKHDG